MKVVAIYVDDDKVRRAEPGENLRVRLSGIEEEDILSGFVLSSICKFVMALEQHCKFFLTTCFSVFNCIFFLENLICIHSLLMLNCVICIRTCFFFFFPGQSI